MSWKLKQDLCWFGLRLKAEVFRNGTNGNQRMSSYQRVGGEENLKISPESQYGWRLKGSNERQDV